MKANCAIGDANPRDLKIDLAKRIIKDFHPAEEAEQAEQNFINQFSKGNLPDEIDEIVIAAGDYKGADLLVETKMVESKGQAKRLIRQGGVKVNGKKYVLEAEPGKIKISGEEVLLQVGKRKFLKVSGK